MESKLYTDYADWWPLFADPAYYASEANWIFDALCQRLGRPPKTLLELGCGGGTLTSYLKQSTRVTASDLEPCMIAVSRRLNPECEHVTGDMRGLRLDWRFDAVLLHDAVNYLTHEQDLVRTLETARDNLLEGGWVIVLPDDTGESFEETTSTGGRDDKATGRGLRYLLWTGAPHGGTYPVDFAVVVRDKGQVIDVLHEKHMFGLFTKHVWQRAFHAAGFPEVYAMRHSLRETVFCARRET